MNSLSAPILSCLKIQSFPLDDWVTAERTMLAAASCPMQQAWRAQPEPEFRPAAVRLGWTDDHLIVFATLDDADIFNPVTEFNVPAFQHGDVFEMFLRPTTQEAYYEIHVNPTNQQFQLRLPAAGVVRSRPMQEFFYDRRRIESRVKILPGRWTVLAAVPLDMVQETSPVGPGTRWRFSFSRYDYTRGRNEPVLSSTSPHQQVDFHRQQEWGELVFS